MLEVVEKPKIIHHRNDWCWGKSVICITDDGYGTATMSITTEHEYSEEEDKLIPIKQAVISGISVYYRHRRQGYGDLLLRECEDEAAKAGFDTVYLWSDPNTPAFEWYKRRGYVECPEMMMVPDIESSTSLVKLKKTFPTLEMKL